MWEGGERDGDKTNVSRDVQGRNRNKRKGSSRRRRKNRTIKIMNTNAQSLIQKMTDLQWRVNLLEPKIISVTETWGKEWIKDGILKLDGYTMYRNDRKEKRGGGSILYINNKLEHRVCRPLNALPFDSSSWCWVSEEGGKKILVGSIYRSTSSTANNDKLLLEVMEKANEVAGDNRVLIMGDFNVPCIDWDKRDLTPGAKIIEAHMLKTVNDCFLYQHVRDATRLRNDQESTLDLIFTKEEEDVKNIEVMPAIGSSDHEVVVGDFVCEWKSRVNYKPRRMYYKGKYDDINHGLEQIDWTIEFENKTVKECWDSFKSKLEELVETNVPMSKPRDYNEPWMNWQLMRLWKRKYFAWKRFTESKSYQRYREYKKETNEMKKQTRKAKREYEKKLANEVRHNKRAFFRYVNSKLTVRPEISEMQNELGELVDNDIDICNILGKYFNSVYSPQSTGEMPDMEIMCENEIKEIVITREEVKTRLEKLNVNKSCGPDNIHPLVLQKTASTSCIPLELIFTKSLQDGECPDDWRSANVTPIHKKGDRADPSNYRPVSLTSQVCKMLETIVRKQLVEHLKENNLLRDEQHGFREGRSCLTNLLETIEQWTEIIDEGDSVDVAYLDFRKAFDLVSHRHLTYKMSKYGITGQLLRWVESFLYHRTQRVVIRGSASESFAVTSGVPQGSVLGPVLFLIYINDLPLDVVSPLSLFADDSKIFTRIVSEKNKRNSNVNGNEILQKDLDTVRNWASKWKMEFNVDKCKIMHLGKRNPKHTYKMDDSNLNETTEEKDLGVLIDCELNFEKHIKEIVNKANRMVGMIKIGFSYLDKDMFMNLYPVLVRPLLEYCVQVWSPNKQKHIDLLEGVQRRATKAVPGLRNMSYEERLRELGLLRLEDRRVRGDMIETYKIISGKEDINSGLFFKMAPVRGDPETARNLKIYKERFMSNKRKFVFSQRVVDKWNSLSNEEVNAAKTSGFKANYDRKEKERREMRDRYPYVSGNRSYTLRVFASANP